MDNNNVSNQELINKINDLESTVLKLKESNSQLESDVAKKDQVIKNLRIKIQDLENVVYVSTRAASKLLD